MTIILFFLVLGQAASSPIIAPEPIFPTGGFISPAHSGPPPNICVLPQELNFSGLGTLVEDCENMYRFGKDPPTSIFYYAGASIFICCPNPPPYQDGLVFPNELDLLNATDEFEESNGEFVYGGMESDDLYYYGDDDVTQTPEQRCLQFPGTTCTEINSCSDEDFQTDSPHVACGWNMATGAEKVCCTKKGTRSSSIQPKIFGDYDCEDFTEYCKIFVSENPDSCQPSHKSYGFMKMACMKSCNICKDKGCRNTFAKCEDWARLGFCVKNSEFMLFHCRESCGTCGFKSARNKESQIVKGKDYTNVTSPQFFCGEGKSKDEVNGQQSLSVRSSITDEIFGKDRRKRSTEVNEEDLELFTYVTEMKKERKIDCGSILINDRFILFAAHCSTQFDNKDQRTQIRTSIVRDGTIYQDQIEIRRVFVHPDFNFPSLYYDIAIAELGRRIIYDYDIYGDSPSCISNGEPILNKVAVSQGYGHTEHGRPSSNLLLGTNVTIIANDDCTKWLRGNTTDSAIAQSTLRETLSQGVNDQMLCTTGFYNETTNAWSGPCEGDSGGPLYVNFGGPDGERRQTLEGIVSGALTCGKNIPSWYTKVFSFRPWIECIIHEVRRGKPYAQVEKICLQMARKFGSENEI